MLKNYYLLMKQLVDWLEQLQFQPTIDDSKSSSAATAKTSSNSIKEQACTLMIHSMFINKSNIQ